MIMQYNGVMFQDATSQTREGGANEVTKTMYDAIEARLLRGESEKWRGVVEIDERYEGGSVKRSRRSHIWVE